MPVISISIVIVIVIVFPTEKASVAAPLPIPRSSTFRSIIIIIIIVVCASHRHMNLPFYCQLYFGGNVINAHFYGDTLRSLSRGCAFPFRFYKIKNQKTKIKYQILISNFGRLSSSKLISIVGSWECGGSAEIVGTRTDDRRPADLIRLVSIFSTFGISVATD